MAGCCWTACPSRVVAGPAYPASDSAANVRSHWSTSINSAARASSAAPSSTVNASAISMIREKSSAARLLSIR